MLFKARGSGNYASPCRKSPQPKRVENGANAKPPNLFSGSNNVHLSRHDHQSRTFHANCTNLHQNWFNHLPPASLDWQKHKSLDKIFISSVTVRTFIYGVHG